MCAVPLVLNGVALCLDICMHVCVFVCVFVHLAHSYVLTLVDVYINLMYILTRVKT